MHPHLDQPLQWFNEPSIQTMRVRVQGQARLNDTGRLEKVSRMIRAKGVNASDVKLLYITRNCSLNYTRDPTPPVDIVIPDDGGRSVPQDWYFLDEAAMHVQNTRF